MYLSIGLSITFVKHTLHWASSSVFAVCPHLTRNENKTGLEEGSLVAGHCYYGTCILDVANLYVLHIPDGHIFDNLALRSRLGHREPSGLHNRTKPILARVHPGNWACDHNSACVVDHYHDLLVG